MVLPRDAMASWSGRAYARTASRTPCDGDVEGVDDPGAGGVGVRAHRGVAARAGGAVPVDELGGAGEAVGDGLQVAVGGSGSWPRAPADAAVQGGGHCRHLGHRVRAMPAAGLGRCRRRRGGQGLPQFGRGPHRLPPGAEHRRGVQVADVHQDVAGGVVGVEEELADAAAVAPAHGVNRPIRSHRSVTRREVPGGRSSIGCARISCSAPCSNPSGSRSAGAGASSTVTPGGSSRSACEVSSAVQRAKSHSSASVPGRSTARTSAATRHRRRAATSARRLHLLEGLWCSLLLLH